MSARSLLRAPAAFVAFLAMSGVVAQGAEPLACPAGTERRSASKAGGAIEEWCIDPKTNLREGPERHTSADGATEAVTNRSGKPHGTGTVRDPNGEIVAEFTFENGEQRSMRLTFAGLKLALKSMEANQGLLNPRFHWEVIDEHTLKMELNYLDPGMLEAPTPALRERILGIPEVCEIYEAPGISVEAIRVNVTVGHDAPKAVGAEEIIERRDCEGRSASR